MISAAWVILNSDSPLLALGEGGKQFDRRGVRDRMISGQGGYDLENHGGRVPIPWLIGTAGWGLFFHQPLGTFDFTGTESTFTPHAPGDALDLFVVLLKQPETLLAEYARLTGHPELPPALEPRPSPVSPHAWGARSRFSAGRPDLPREEAALRCHRIPGYGLLP